MLAILSAIAEVIKENHMEDNNDDESTEPSGVEYFGALLTSLDTADTSEGLSATIALLSIVIKTIDKELLRAKFSISAKLLFELLSRHGESDDPSIISEKIILGSKMMMAMIQNLHASLPLGLLCK